MGIVQAVPRQSCRYPIAGRGADQPRFSFSSKAVSAASPALQGAKAPPVPAKQGQQRSVPERIASPGNGAVHGVWGTAPTSKNGLPAVTLEVHFEHLWEQMHCSPSSAYLIKCANSYQNGKSRSCNSIILLSAKP